MVRGGTNRAGLCPTQRAAPCPDTSQHAVQHSVEEQHPDTQCVGEVGCLNEGVGGLDAHLSPLVGGEHLCPQGEAGRRQDAGGCLGACVELRVGHCIVGEEAAEEYERA
eukprot:CAMPEP_0173172822 /NCGR_PEP_ID=MMETSP1141-20130122/2511_1 /TAXON_ID=483371 /ORGANISM="non described non described, Strain CCMP2298" /LENGTH=108 /DNA_ID=CAMNT_0014094879 /DNA_START=40 /DNA_END=370 /DNA_ORIENTATION=-